MPTPRAHQQFTVRSGVAMRHHSWNEGLIPAGKRSRGTDKDRRRAEVRRRIELMHDAMALGEELLETWEEE